MGKAKKLRGVRVRQIPSGNWLGEAWDPRRKKYISKTRQTESAARKWAEEQRARIILAIEGEALDPRKALMSLLIPEYISDLMAGRRVGTYITETKRVLTMLGQDLKDLGNPNARSIIKTWLNTSTVDLSASSRNARLIAIRAFCRWAIRHGYIQTDPTAAIERSHVEQYLPPQFTIGECRRLLARIDDPYHLLFAVMIYTGLRFQEAAHIRWEDFEWDDDIVMVRLREGVRIKRKKERMVPLQSELRHFLWPQRITAGELFPGRCHNSNRSFHSFLRRAGIPIDGRSPHACRHTYAGMMSASGVSDSILGAYLGHSSAATTQKYTKMATRYVAGTDGWKRGRLSIVTGWTETIARE